MCRLQTVSARNLTGNNGVDSARKKVMKNNNKTKTKKKKKTLSGIRLCAATPRALCESKMPDQLMLPYFTHSEQKQENEWNNLMNKMKWENYLNCCPSVGLICGIFPDRLHEGITEARILLSAPVAEGQDSAPVHELPHRKTTRGKSKF